MEYFLSVVGMVFIIEAVPYILFPAKVKEVARYIEKLSDRTLNIIGLVLAFSGIAVIYTAKYLLGK